MLKRIKNIIFGFIDYYEANEIEISVSYYKEINAYVVIVEAFSRQLVIEFFDYDTPMFQILVLNAPYDANYISPIKNESQWLRHDNLENFMENIIDKIVSEFNWKSLNRQRRNNTIYISIER